MYWVWFLVMINVIFGTAYVTEVFNTSTDHVFVFCSSLFLFLILLWW